jgi:hypothetical protein
MLKAVIIYVQGSAGNLLNRTLTLDSNTIPILPAKLSLTQPYVNMTPGNRLRMYNNWDYLDWTTTEMDLSMWYKNGANNFVDYELSNKLLIDSMHPCMFYNNHTKMVWTNDNFWENIIFIDWKDSNLNDIIHNANMKRIDLEQEQQISKEVPMFKKLMELYPNSHTIHWESTLHLDTYLKEVHRLTEILSLDIDDNLVEMLWHKWHSQSNMLLNN